MQPDDHSTPPDAGAPAAGAANTSGAVGSSDSANGTGGDGVAAQPASSRRPAGERGHSDGDAGESGAPGKRRRQRRRGRGGKGVKPPRADGVSTPDGVNDLAAELGTVGQSRPPREPRAPRAPRDPNAPRTERNQERPPRAAKRPRNPQREGQQPIDPDAQPQPGQRLGARPSGRGNPRNNPPNNPRNGARTNARSGTRTGTRDGTRTESNDDAQPGADGVDFKLQKLLAEAGLGSRRDMEEAIQSGRVSVDGKIVSIGTRIGRGAVVRVDGKIVKIRTGRETPEVIIYHKPTGEIVTHDDPEGRTSVFEKVPPPKSGKWIAVGRLDYNTEGLLLLTNSGDLANRLMHPRYEVEREYSVRVIGELNDEQTDLLLDGVPLDDGPARFMKLDEGEFSDEGEGINRWYRVMIREGRNREVRRMFEAVGVTVSRLIRTRFGPIALPRMLKRGQTRALTPEELKELTRATPVAAAAVPFADGNSRGDGGARRGGSGPQSHAAAGGDANLVDDDDDSQPPMLRDDAPRKRGRNARGSNAMPGVMPGLMQGAEGENNPRRRRGKGRLSGAAAGAGQRAAPGNALRGRPSGSGAGVGRKSAGRKGAARSGAGVGRNAAAGRALLGAGRARSGPAKKGRRGKLDPASMTLDGRRAGVVRDRRVSAVPAPKKAPVIIHRRSKLKIMPEPGGDGGAA